MILQPGSRAVNNKPMALNKEVFKTRALTALVFVIIMLTGLFWNGWSFTILFAVIHFGCWFEFIKLVKRIKGDRFFLYSLAGLLYITMPVLLLFSLAFDFEIRTAGAAPFESYTYSSLYTCGIIFSIWINDTMAYIVGSLVGKTPFSKISPKKTWEGTGGGALLCVLVIGLLGYFIPAAKQLAVQHWVAIAAICAVAGTAGDLLESKIKRMADVKDSGSFMPGHGGFLDRFDSLLVATPFVWLYVQLFV